jgi:SAM-dependent methyltransferase
MTQPPPTCRCCGSTNVSLRGRKQGRFIRREFEFYTCGDCTLLFVEPFSGFEIYDDAYYRGQGPDPYVDYETEYRDWRATDRALEFDDLVRIADARLGDGEDRPVNREASDTSPSTLRWLDFGCGAGAFLKYLGERRTLAGRPIDVTGHDVGSYADLLAQQDGFRILDLEAIEREPDERYDVISMIEVIEHLPSPATQLALVARLLKPGGLLLLTTGNLDCAAARGRGIHYRYCTPEIHVSLFNPRCLERLYRSVGLEPMTVQYHDAVRFKVKKNLRYRPVLRALASAFLHLPFALRAVDTRYGVSAMPCAVKPRHRTPSPAPSLQAPDRGVPPVEVPNAN